MATLTLTYTGTVTAEGAIKLPKRLRPEVVKAFAGKSIEVTFRRVRNYRSSEQNRYYWGVVVPLVCEGFRDAGNDLQSSNPEHCQLIHDYLKSRFLPARTVADANGEQHSLPPTTTALSTSEMMDYIAQVQQFAAEFLNVNIPDPGEQTTREV